MAFIKQERRVFELSVIQRQLRLFDENDGAGLHLHSSLEAGLDLPSKSDSSDLMASSDSHKAEVPVLSDSQETEIDLLDESFPLSSDSRETRLHRLGHLEELELSRNGKNADAMPKEHSECHFIGWGSVFYGWLLAFRAS